jgi:hypothetical protein
MGVQVINEHTIVATAQPQFPAFFYEALHCRTIYDGMRNKWRHNPFVKQAQTTLRGYKCTVETDGKKRVHRTVVGIGCFEDTFFQHHHPIIEADP